MRFALFSLFHIGAGAVSQLQLQELSNVALNRNGMQSHMTKALNGVLASLIVAKQKNEKVPPSLITAFSSMVNEFVSDIEEAYDSQHANVQKKIDDKYENVETWMTSMTNNKIGAETNLKTWSKCLSDANTTQRVAWEEKKSNLRDATTSLHTKMLTRQQNSQFSSSVPREQLTCTAADCTGKFQEFNTTWQDKMTKLTDDVRIFTDAFAVFQTAYTTQATLRDQNVTAKNTARTNLRTELDVCKGIQDTLRQDMCAEGKYGHSFEKLCGYTDDWVDEVTDREADLISQVQSWSVQRRDLCVVSETFYYIVNEQVDNSHTYDNDINATNSNMSSILNNGLTETLDNLVNQWKTNCATTWGIDKYYDGNRAALVNADVAGSPEKTSCDNPALTMDVENPPLTDWNLIDWVTVTDGQVKLADIEASSNLKLLDSQEYTTIQNAENFGNLDSVFVAVSNDWSLDQDNALTICTSW